MTSFRAALSFISTLLIFFTLSQSSLAETSSQFEGKTRPTIGLVLGGGGAKGAAHVGVLQFLEDNRIPIDIAVGTSAGSAVAALYAMGTSANDIKTTFLSTDWEKGYVDSTPRPDLSIRRKQDQRQFAMDLDLGYGNGRFLIPKGIIQGQRLQILLNEMTMAAATIEDFDQLPLRYRAVATDLETGKEVVLGKGNLAKAIRASMAVPGIFTPVEINDKTLIDGGLANNLPINVARELGADIVIAVDLATPLRKSEEIQTSLEVLSQLSDYMTGNNTAEQLSTLNGVDIYIKPEFGDIGSASFDRVDETIQLGQMSAQLQKDALNKLSISQSEYEAYQNRRQSFLATKPIINKIKLINQSKLNDQMILARIQQTEGQVFNPSLLEQDLGLIYGLGYFESITYLLETESDGSNSLVINAKQKSWGPNLIRFGIEMEDNFNGNSEYGLSSSLLTTGINRFGAEWVNTIKIGSSPSFFSEFYQPLDYDADYFARSYALLERFEANSFTNGVSTATYQVRERQFGLEFGRNFDTYADLAIGLFGGGGKAEIIVGDPNTPDINFDSGAYYLRAYYDRLDDQFFPSEGLYFQTQYARNRTELGADQNSDRLSYEGILATQVGQWMTHLGFKGSILTDKIGGIEDDFRLGGLFNLSGFSSGELSGDEGIFAYIKILHQMSQGFEWFVGTTLEAGNVYAKDDSVNLGELETAGSLFVAANTFLGPVIFGYGYANKEDQAFYLSIGNTF